MFGSLSNWVSSKIPVQLPNILNTKKEESEEEQKKTQEETASAPEVKQEATSANAEPQQSVEKAAEETKSNTDEAKGDSLKEDPFANLVHLDKQKAIETAKNLGSNLSLKI